MVLLLSTLIQQFVLTVPEGCKLPSGQLSGTSILVQPEQYSLVLRRRTEVFEGSYHQSSSSILYRREQRTLSRSYSKDSLIVLSKNLKMWKANLRTLLICTNKPMHINGTNKSTNLWHFKCFVSHESHICGGVGVKCFPPHGCWVPYEITSKLNMFLQQRRLCSPTPAVCRGSLPSLGMNTSMCSC